MWGMIEVPETKDFLTNITGVKDVATTIALTAKQDTIVVTKSTVPVGTNDRLLQIIDHNKLYHINIEIVSNPEFLKEGSAIERKTLKTKFPVSVGSCLVK